MQWISILLLVVGARALAMSPQQTEDLLNEGYDPAIRSTEGKNENFLDLCQQRSVEVIGKDPILLSDRTIRGSFFVPITRKDPKRLPTVIILPPTGGVTPLDIGYAVMLCQREFRVLLVKGWDHDVAPLEEEDLDMHDRAARRMVVAIRHITTFLNPQVDDQIGLLGTSVGGISASLVMALDPRLSVGVLVVAGAGMVDIIGRSTQSTLARLREERMRDYKLNSIEEYLQLLKDHVRIDPLNYVGTKKSKKIMMVIATKDTTVPSENQLKLAEAYGDAEIISYAADHITSIIAAFTIDRERIVNIFENNLKP